MQLLRAKTIKAKSPFQTKMVFWSLFVGSRGAPNRIRIMSALRKMSSNRNQLAIELGIEYKAIQHHLKVLEKNNLVRKTGNRYGLTYCVSALFKHNENVFDEIVDRLKNLRLSYSFVTFNEIPQLSLD
ncbi:MAG: winged helix-turn-helix transcriptional regulator [Thaumarchaeota archaeon]|nr:winged helix-turn-helix transcriptional regulator [Nitrososphaerota archaeon]